MPSARQYHPVTLGTLADQGLDVWAWCNGCFKNGPVDTDGLIARLGRVSGPAGWVVTTPQVRTLARTDKIHPKRARRRSSVPSGQV